MNTGKAQANAKEAKISMALDFKAPCKFTFSANEIRTASECARKRYYSSRDCLCLRANKPAKALVLGDAIHKCLQYYYTELDKRIKEANLTDLTYDNIADLMDTIPDFELQNIDDLDEESFKIYDLVTNMYLAQIITDLMTFEVVACEQAFHIDNWPINDVMYHGYIDMVVKDRTDGKIYFFEHKSCTNFRPDIYDRFDIQLHIYACYGQFFNELSKSNFGGMILNQLKKAKTDRGYGCSRKTFTYTDQELNDFVGWLKAKTEAVISPDNKHAPCNNFMTCKMCEYAPICMKYGYELPVNTDAVLSEFFDEAEDGTKTPMFKYDPRASEEEEG